ncbi:hypothetical protein AC579_8093 [Lecanosticta acicola]|uniref:F-box domain-containing protein n=1 Tax=Lecanosticta acicola TaxID=111012 RepID=A0AAI8Z3V9_9PEZI|nr:hypothetical protein AC579_8093 [Lecanosticta acicola]
MSSPTSKVFQTYELLERILLFLPFHDRFVVQRTCRTWRSLIHRSKIIRQEMYLAPAGSPLKPIEDAYNVYAGRTRSLYRPTPVRLNLAAEVLGLINEPSGRGHRIPLATFGVSDQNLFLQFDIKGMPVYETKIAHEAASWRRMLLTQPPITAVNFEFIRRDPHGGAVTVYNPSGVTFGDLHEMSLKLAREFELVTGEDSELTFENMSFCLFHPFTEDGMEEAW